MWKIVVVDLLDGDIDDDGEYIATGIVFDSFHVCVRYIELLLCNVLVLCYLDVPLQGSVPEQRGERTRRHSDDDTNGMY